MASSDSTSLEYPLELWLLNIREGIEQTCQELAVRGEHFLEMRIEIVSIRDHPVDSSAEAFRQCARQFVLGDLCRHTEVVPALDECWRTPDVLTLARQIRERNDWTTLPILADALEESGCDCSFLLDHCRQAADHRGRCWAIESILGSKPVSE